MINEFFMHLVFQTEEYNICECMYATNVLTPSLLAQTSILHSCNTSTAVKY